METVFFLLPSLCDTRQKSSQLFHFLISRVGVDGAKITAKKQLWAQIPPIASVLLDFPILNGEQTGESSASSQL